MALVTQIIYRSATERFISAVNDTAAITVIFIHLLVFDVT